MSNNNTVQAFWVGIGSLSKLAAGIITAVILSRFLDKFEYGTYRQILYVYNTLLVVFTAGLPKVFAYYLPKFSIQEGKAIVWKISGLLFFLGLIFSFSLYFSSNFIAILLNNQELEHGLKLFSPIPALLLPTLGIEGIFSTYKKTIYIAIYNTITRLLMVVLIVSPVIWFDANFIYAIYGWIIASILILITAYYFKNIPFRNVESEKTNLKVKEILAYSIPIATASIAGIIIKAADQFYISRFYGVEVFAEFANGFMQLPFVGMITGAVSVVLMPQFSKIINDETHIDEIVKLWKSAIFKSAILIYPLVIFFLMNSETIMIILYSEVYANSSSYFTVALFLNFFNIIIFTPLILSMGKTKFYAIVHWVIALFAWVLGYFVVILFDNPISIAILSVGLSISLILTFVYYIVDELGTTLYHLFPVKDILLVASHSIMLIIPIKYLVNSILVIDNNLISIFIMFLIYSMSLVITSKIFNIDYLNTISNLTRYLKTKWK